MFSHLPSKRTGGSNPNHDGCFPCPKSQVKNTAVEGFLLVLSQDKWFVRICGLNLKVPLII